MSSSKKSYPSTLEGFGYAFNDEGQLRKIDAATGKVGSQPFDFNISSDHRENQKHYEALGDVITEHVYKLLDEQGLHRIYIPQDVPQEEASFVYCTQKKLENPEKLMILIHGAGVVRAGQWARSLIINDPGLKAGSVLPYIEKSRELGYEVLITNSNLNHYQTPNGREVPINGSETPSNHGATVWREIVQPANPGAIGIVAHSYGGIVAVDVANKFQSDFKEKVFAIGMTDSVHYGGKVVEGIKGISRNWVTSSEPLDTPVRASKNDVPCFSAGHTKHEMTSYSCMEALFQFFESRYEEFSRNSGNDAKKPRVDL